MNDMVLPIQAAAGGSMGGMALVAQLVLLFAVMYFLIIRPQQKRAKAHAAKINAVAKGNEVVTGGGLIGKVTKVADDHIEIEIASGVRVKAVKSTIAEVRGVQAAND
jgi:preprotein translocase subunit YajC